MPRVKELTKVICIRVTDTTATKLTNLIEEKFPDMSVSEMAREALVRGIAKLESEKK